MITLLSSPGVETPVSPPETALVVLTMARLKSALSPARLLFCNAKEHLEASRVIEKFFLDDLEGFRASIFFNRGRCRSLASTSFPSSK